MRRWCFLLEVFIYRRGYIIVRKCLIVIMIKFRVDIDNDMLLKKLYILYKNVFFFLWIRKILDLSVFVIMKWGSRKIIIRRFDVVMLVIIRMIFFFILIKVVIRREFFMKDVKSVKMCNVIIICVGRLKYFFWEGVLLLFVVVLLLFWSEIFLNIVMIF